MREIKFRLILNEKIVGYEKWYGGKFSKIDGQTSYPCWLYSKDNKNWNPDFIWHKQKNKYIGIEDVNKIEIYEEDRVKHLQPEDDNIYIVIWSDDAMAWGLSVNIVDAVANKDFKWPNFLQLEVIGNIYENPELLQNNDAHTAL